MHVRQGLHGEFLFEAENSRKAPVNKKFDIFQGNVGEELIGASRVPVHSITVRIDWHRWPPTDTLSLCNEANAIRITHARLSCTPPPVREALFESGVWYSYSRS